MLGLKLDHVWKWGPKLHEFGCPQLIVDCWHRITSWIVVITDSRNGLLHMWCLVRKSKDYVYGIWVYKVLSIWKGYCRVKKSLVSCMKPWTKARNDEYMKYHSKLTYQLSFWNVSRKMDYHAGGKWFIHGPKRHRENQLLSLKHPCWLSLA